MTIPEAIELWVKKNFAPQYHDAVIADIKNAFTNGDTRSFYISAKRDIDTLRSNA